MLLTPGLRNKTQHFQFLISAKIEVFWREKSEIENSGRNRELPGGINPEIYLIFDFKPVKPQLWTVTLSSRAEPANLTPLKLTAALSCGKTENIRDYWELTTPRIPDGVRAALEGGLGPHTHRSGPVLPQYALPTSVVTGGAAATGSSKPGTGSENGTEPRPRRPQRGARPL